MAVKLGGLLNQRVQDALAPDENQVATDEAAKQDKINAFYDQRYKDFLKTRKVGEFVPDKQILQMPEANPEGDFSAGIQSGVLGFKTIGRGAQALLGDLTESDLQQKVAYEKIQEYQKELADLNRGRTTQLEDIDNISEAIDYVQFQAGNILPSVAESLGAAAIGALAGTATAGPVGTVGAGAAGLFGKTAMKKYLTKKAENYIAKGMAKDVANQAAERALKKRVGAGMALWASGGVIGAGDIYQETMDETGQGNAIASLLGAVPYAAVDALTEISLLGNIGAGTLGKSALLTYAKEIGKGALKEGTAESAQEAIKLVAGLNSGKTYTSDQVLSQLGNSFVAGGIGGMAFGLIGAQGATKDPTIIKDENLKRAKDIAERIGTIDPNKDKASFTPDYTQVENPFKIARGDESVYFENADIAKASYHMQKYRQLEEQGVDNTNTQTSKAYTEKLIKDYVLNDKVDPVDRMEAIDALQLSGKQVDFDQKTDELKQAREAEAKKAEGEKKLTDKELKEQKAQEILEETYTKAFAPEYKEPSTKEEAEAYTEAFRPESDLIPEQVTDAQVEKSMVEAYRGPQDDRQERQQVLRVLGEQEQRGTEEEVGRTVQKQEAGSEETSTSGVFQEPEVKESPRIPPSKPFIESNGLYFSGYNTDGNPTWSKSPIEAKTYKTDNQAKKTLDTLKKDYPNASLGVPEKQENLSSAQSYQTFKGDSAYIKDTDYNVTDLDRDIEFTESLSGNTIKTKFKTLLSEAKNKVEGFDSIIRCLNK